MTAVARAGFSAAFVFSVLLASPAQTWAAEKSCPRALSSIYLKTKRLADVIAVVVVSPIVIPTVAVLGLLVTLDSNGPAIFVQDRVGQNGQVFRIYKLRTMHSNSGAPFTYVNDTRVTNFGRFLRRWRIDELPQIFNILKGEMSWVGPRPHSVENQKRLEAQMPAFVGRLAVLPGLTGLAQVQKGADMDHDLDYVDRASWGLDLWILARTPRAVLGGFNAR